MPTLLVRVGSPKLLSFTTEGVVMYPDYMMDVLDQFIDQQIEGEPTDHNILTEVGSFHLNHVPALLVEVVQLDDTARWVVCLSELFNEQNGEYIYDVTQEFERRNSRFWQFREDADLYRFVHALVFPQGWAHK